MKAIKRAYNLILGVTLLVTLSSCATIMNGPQQSIGICSNPTNAMIFLDTAYMGQTPIIVKMTRNNNHLVRLELDGYEPYEIVFSKEISGWVFGNIVFGGAIGLVVDLISGGIYRLTPDQVQAELRSNNIAYSKSTKESYIAVVLQPNPAWEKVGNLVANN